MKYHCFLHYEIEKYEENRAENSLADGATLQNLNKGFLHNACQWLKIDIDRSSLCLLKMEIDEKINYVENIQNNPYNKEKILYGVYNGRTV